MALSVPQNIHRGLRALAELDSGAVERLAKALSEASPAGLDAMLVSEVSSRLGEPSLPDLTEIVRSLVILHAGLQFHEMVVPEFVAEITEGLRGLCDESATRLAERLKRLLGSNGAPAITSEASDIPSDHGPATEPVTVEKSRRQMGKDIVWIAEDFNAPLSPEEEELFGSIS
jgi:hypothetical protein